MFDKFKNNDKNSQQNLAMASAQRILALRNHSKNELISKLEKRGFDSKIIDLVIKDCICSGWINDNNTALLLADELKKRGYGVFKIKYEMKKRGIASEIAGPIIEEYMGSKEEFMAARKIFIKRKERFEREKDELRRKRKIHGFLSNRGFSNDAIQYVFQDEF